MVKRTKRWRSPPPKVLSTPESARVFHCYAIEGKAYIHHGQEHCGGEVVLVNASREVVIVPKSVTINDWYGVDEPPPGDWLVLGYRLPNNEMRYGEYDAVDPEMADLEKLPRPNRVAYEAKEALGHLISTLNAADMLPWDEHGNPEIPDRVYGPVR